MDNIGLFLGIVIFILIAFYILIIILTLGISAPINGPPPVPEVNIGEFMSSCAVTPCNGNLICDGTTYTCRLPEGSPCSDFSDCTVGLICSGLCATGATGGLNNLCPCDSGLTCVSGNPGSLSLCKGNGGFPCSDNSQCASAFCLPSNVCAAGAPNAYPCNLNSECASQNCNNNFCQPPGITTATQGAACATPCVSFAGASCGINLTCLCSQGIGVPGVCVTATQGIISSCSESSPCANTLVCYNNTIPQNCTTLGNCNCIFPYEDPNALGPGNSCIGGMTPFEGACYNSVNLACQNGGQCSSQVCNNPSMMSMYIFKDTLNTTLGPVFIGATQTTISPKFQGPPGNLLPYKMFAVSNGFLDIIYLVDANIGFYSVTYDTSSQIAGFWTTLIPHEILTVGGTQILVDVALISYPNMFLVAFNETSGINQNYTVYIWDTTTFTPFNPTIGTGLIGTQYTTGGSPLDINYIDVSPPNNISAGGDVLIAINGTVYIKAANTTTYTVALQKGGPTNNQPITNTVGPVRFYFDITENPAGTTGIPPVCPASTDPSVPIACPSINNIAYVSSFQSGTGPQLDQVLQFSGNIAGIALPADRYNRVQYNVYDYSIYSPPDGIIYGQQASIGMPSAAIITLTSGYDGSTFIDNMVSLTFGGPTARIPYRISLQERSVASANAFYILSIASCS